MKSISRTIATMTVESKAVKVVDGEMVTRDLEPLKTMEGRTGAEKELKKQLAEEESLVITNITKEEKVYEVPLDKFIELSDKLETEKENQEKSEVK